MEINLAPIDRIVFLRLLISYGGRKILITDLKVLAKEVKVNWLTLKKSLGVLVEKGLCEQLEKKVIQLNKVLLPRQVGYRWIWKPFNRQSIFFEKKEENSQRVDELAKDQLVPFSIKNTEIKKAASGLVARYPRHDFLEILFDLMFDVKISHKQKNADELLELNYKQWLVLVNMVLSSDANGIVFDVGTYELSKWTGMSRNALQRAIADLFDKGILRSKLDGTLNNNLLNSVAPVYCLNLSAAIWGEKRIFGHYYFLKFPNEYTSIVEQAFNFIQYLAALDQAEKASSSCNSIVNELAKVFDEVIDQTIQSKLGNAIREEFNFVSQSEKNFGQYIQLMIPSFRMGKSSLNTDQANVARIDFFLNYLIQVKISNIGQAEIWLNSPMPRPLIAWFDQYLTKIKLPEFQPKSTSCKENSQVIQIPLKQLVEESRAKILFAICQTLLSSEMMLIIKDVRKLMNSKVYFDLAVLPSQNSDRCDRVYFCRYGAEEIEQKTEQDTFHLLEFQQISVDPVEYVLNGKELKLSLEDQKQYGLFNPKNNNKS
jgi:predicted transcriptional regulator